MGFDEMKPSVWIPSECGVREMKSSVWMFDANGRVREMRPLSLDSDAECRVREMKSSVWIPSECSGCATTPSLDSGQENHIIKYCCKSGNLCLVRKSTRMLSLSKRGSEYIVLICRGNLSVIQPGLTRD